ncbi:MAG: hypothetical protein IKP17_08180 [Oscillospiraceae bacterium]|nr:hypothetical protein [Oscillospiraceae bacterium]
MEQILNENRRQCKYALTSAVVVVLCVIAGVTMNLTTVNDENFDNMGLRTFCMFTVNSNLFAGAALALVFPFTVEGIRKHNYHMPNWVVDLVYMGVTAVTLTFLISLFVLSPVKGFRLIFTGSRFFLHGICPILAANAFCFFISDHRVGIGESFLPLIPVSVYAALYYVMVVVIGEENGGWRDFYGFATFVPVWIPMALILPLTYAIATFLRLLHNRLYDRRRKEEAELYTREFGGKDIRESVAALARAQARVHRLSVIPVPIRIISLMVERSGGDCSVEEACDRYMEAYLADRRKALEASLKK